MRVPLGVIAIIYESRPNVTVDAAALCIKSGNSAILRGGSEAIESNRVLAQIVRDGLVDAGLPADAVQLVDTTDRAAVGALAQMTEYVDLLVPRGGRGLIERLMRESRVPMLKHLDGICHVYIDGAADVDKAIAIADNAKTQRYGTCNTMETLLVAQSIAAQVLPALGRIYQSKGVELRCCPESRADSRSRRHDRCHRCRRRRLAHRIPGADPFDLDAARRRRSDLAHQHLRQQAHRRDRYRELRDRDAVRARSRFSVGHRQRFDALCRRV